MVEIGRIYFDYQDIYPSPYIIGDLCMIAIRKQRIAAQYISFPVKESISPIMKRFGF